MSMSGWGRQASGHNLPRTRGPSAAAETDGLPRPKTAGLAQTSTSPLS
jgi:hypothetical protein